MARQSFTLRRGVGGSASVGAYLQYPSEGTASTFSLSEKGYNDNALRSDGFESSVTILSSGGSFFQAEPISHTQVELTWGTTLTDLLEVEYNPTQVVVLYSPIGPPETLREGVLLIETTTDNSYIHTVPEGTWAYYTLFIKYESSIYPTYYYPTSRISVLVPKNRGGTDSLYKHIPNYIRDMDTSQDLYNFLSIFGFDLDRIRTLLEYFMVMRDPWTARGEDLDQVSSDFGFPITTNDLGLSRLRNLLDRSGDYRRSKGTALSIERTLSAITGSTVSVDNTSNEIRISPQRVNWLKNPDASNSTYWNTVTSGGTKTLSTKTSDVYVNPGDKFVFSMQTSAQDDINEVYLFVHGSSPHNKYVTSTSPRTIAGRKYWELPISIGASVGAYDLGIVMGTSSNPIGNLLLENGTYGEYFDGDTDQGGWIVDDGGQISDYSWEGTANASRSFYTTNYVKTKAVVGRILPLLLPVDQLLTTGTAYSNQEWTLNYPNCKWTVVFDYMAN